MKPGQPRYLAYLLRLWCVGGNGEPAWRASLENAHTGERLGFAHLSALVAFLEQATRTGPAGPASGCCSDSAENRE
jgi:hypothetical protein